jgi:sulfur carrier protein
MGNGPYPSGMRFFIFMNLTVNGNSLVTDASTISGLLKELDINRDLVAVEVNLSIIRKADYSTYNLKDGDTVEVINFVGGG